MTEEIRQLIYDLTDSEDCDYDHHGYCQAHMWFEDETPCPHKRAKGLLGNEAWTRVTINTRSTPVLQMDEDGEWRINVGGKRGPKNILNYDAFPDDPVSLEYWLVRKPLDNPPAD